jgi:threonine/homoserine/homoserine lactone efflux protein
MNLLYFLEGALIGFSLAVPVGPVGLLCLRRTLENGTTYGLVIGVSAACCDLVNGAVAAFGVTLISGFVTLQQHWISLIGGILLLLIGFGAFRTHLLKNPAVQPRGGYSWAIVSTALLVFTNPLTIFAFAAAFAFIGIKDVASHPVSGLMLLAGVFLGSLTWFVLLASLVHLFREKVMRVGLTLVNRVAGGLMMVCGLYALWNSVMGL